MKLSNVFIAAAMNRGHKPTMGSRIAGMCFLLFFALAVLFAGVITREKLWLLLGAIWTIIDAAILATLIIINVHRNRPRW